ncbi:hypothetical protein GIB67_000079 [Kingdonia uniflora]|uniref:F-box domain-containing protein n=1 Tax=Kingdonia uniflora TaxID=39325 RepID=A0A7J7M7S1_9MAGN|nr:hypothetical protein GIB67_000079 [Kingdonia uniflora]
MGKAFPKTTIEGPTPATIREGVGMPIMSMTMIVEEEEGSKVDEEATPSLTAKKGKGSTYEVINVLRNLVEIVEMEESVSKKQNTGTEEDVISDLPGDILQHILSFLPVKCVVATSCLSKRWRYIWTKVQVVDFEDVLFYSPIGEEPERRKNFMNFVDKLLSFPIMLHKFSFSLHGEFDESLLQTWISTVIERKVQHLSLTICLFGQSFVFPSSLYGCGSLISLKLEMNNSNLEVPTLIFLPNLKTLHLSFITFPDDSSTQNLFSSCPVLEELIIDNCKCIDMKKLCISVTTLKRLTLDSPYDEREEKEMVGCVIKIYAANLISFRCRSYVSGDYDIGHLSSLVDAEINLLHNPLDKDRMEETGIVACKLLQFMSNVKVLKICNGTFKCLSYRKDLLRYLPTFHNLIHLEVNSKVIDTIQVLIDVLQVSPNLEHLVLTRGFCSYFDTGDDVCMLNTTRSCLFVHLKAAAFMNFEGYKTESYLLKFLLENARVLEKVAIECSNLSPKKMQRVMKLILMLPKLSESCVIEFF